MRIVCTSLQKEGQQALTMLKRDATMYAMRMERAIGNIGDVKYIEGYLTGSV